MIILLADDDKDSRQSIADFLISLDHKVIECTNGIEALNALKVNKVHLVLSDIMMPEMDGIDLLKSIKRNPEYKNLVVVLFTGFKDVNNAIEALRSGAYDYLLKPVKPEELVSITEKISEYLSLKEENTELKENFNAKLNEATKEVQNELQEVKKAFVNAVGIGDIGVFSTSMKNVYKTADKLHKKPEIPVLIEGETGTGKEVLAKYIHYGRGNVTSPFIGLNCAAISLNLFESELFGYEKGAFTGGNPKGQKGKLTLAENGSVFLDEITELTTDYQAKLLRVIQEREYFQVGGVKKYTTDARFICATNVNIEKKIVDGEFRQDLYYRLNIGRLVIPPLRKRPDEIMPLADLFLRKLYDDKRTTFTGIDSDAERTLLNYDYPGNIRELKNIIERVSFLSEDKIINPGHLKFIGNEKMEFKSGSVEPVTEGTIIENLVCGDIFDLKEFNEQVINRTLEKFSYNKSKTAQFLKISRYEIYTHLDKQKVKKS